MTTPSFDLCHVRRKVQAEPRSLRGLEPLGTQRLSVSPSPLPLGIFYNELLANLSSYHFQARELWQAMTTVLGYHHSIPAFLTNVHLNLSMTLVCLGRVGWCTEFDGTPP